VSAVLRSELRRTLMIRSSWVTIAFIIAAGLGFGVFSVDFWTLFVGLGAFTIAATTTAQHYEHRTAVLLFLGRPHRLRTLAAQCIAAAIITTATAALSGLTVGREGGETDAGQYATTLLVIPLITCFGVALATLVRRPTWLLIGSMVWLLFVEGLLGKLKAPLPFTAFLTASTGNGRQLLVFVGWTALSLVVAGYAINRDLTGE
jgi:hypothetical protein